MFNSVVAAQVQQTCELYLKHILDMYSVDFDGKAEILHKHSLRPIMSKLREYVPDFKFNKNILSRVDGYYFTGRYPGDENFEIGPEDREDCEQAIEHIYKIVHEYVLAKESKSDTVIFSENVAELITCCNEGMYCETTKEIFDSLPTLIKQSPFLKLKLK